MHKVTGMHRYTRIHEARTGERVYVAGGILLSSSDTHRCIVSKDFRAHVYTYAGEYMHTHKFMIVAGFAA